MSTAPDIDGRGGGETFCEKCRSALPRRGPDPCLGRMSDVSAACCGHGKYQPYIAIAGDINEPTALMRPVWEFAVRASLGTPRTIDAKHPAGAVVRW